MGDNVRVKNDEIESNGRRYQDTPPDFAATMRSLRVEMQSCREENERLVKDQKDQNHLNATMLQSLIELQIKMGYGHGTVNPGGRRAALEEGK